MYSEQEQVHVPENEDRIKFSLSLEKLKVNRCCVDRESLTVTNNVNLLTTSKEKISKESAGEPKSITILQTLDKEHARLRAAD